MSKLGTMLTRAAGQLEDAKLTLTRAKEADADAFDKVMIGVFLREISELQSALDGMNSYVAKEPIE